MKPFLLIVASVFFYQNANAEWSLYGTPSHFRLYDGSTFLGTHSALSVSDTESKCGNTNNPGQYSFKAGEVYTAPLVSMILAAEMSGRQIRVYMSGTCFENRPEINGVDIADN